MLFVERRRAGKSDKDAELTQQKLIYTAPDTDDTPLKSRPARDSDKSRAPSDRDKAPARRNGEQSRAAGDVDKSRPLPKPRAASTSDELRASTTSLDRSLESDAVRPRPRVRGSQESLDKSLDKPVPSRRPRGPLDDRPTPAMRAGSMESLDSVGRPKPRARASLDRSLDDSSELSERPGRPQVPVKNARKPANKQRGAMSSDETDV